MRKLWGDETLISNIFSSASFRLSLSISLFLFITPFHSNYPYHGIDDVVIHVPSHFFAHFILVFFSSVDSVAAKMFGFDGFAFDDIPMNRTAK